MASLKGSFINAFTNILKIYDEQVPSTRVYIPIAIHEQPGLKGKAYQQRNSILVPDSSKSLSYYLPPLEGLSYGGFVNTNTDVILNIQIKKVKEYTGRPSGGVAYSINVSPNANKTLVGIFAETSYGAAPDYYDTIKENYCVTAIDMYWKNSPTKPLQLLGQATPATVSAYNVLKPYICEGYQYHLNGENSNLNHTVRNTYYESLTDIFWDTLGVYHARYFFGAEPICLNPYQSAVVQGVTFPQGTYVILLPTTDEEEAKNSIAKNLNAKMTDIPFGINDAENIKNGGDLPYFVPSGVPTNGTGGGENENSGDNNSDPIEINDTVIDMRPSFAGPDLWALSSDELDSVLQFVWTPHIGGLEQHFNLFQDLSNCWVSCMYYPFDIDEHDHSAMEVSEVIVGAFQTDLLFNKIAHQYNSWFSLGTLSLYGYYGSFLDYSPYTKVEIYLPYIGIKPLDTSKVMNKTIELKYSIDFVAGACTAYIIADGSLVNMFSGMIGIPVGVSGLNLIHGFSEHVQNMLNTAVAAGSVVGAISSGGAVGAGAALTLATGTTELIGRYGIGQGAYDSASNLSERGDPEYFGNAGFETWLAAPQAAYLIITRPKYSEPANIADTIGYAANYGGTVSSFSGFLQCSAVVNTVDTTTEEKDFITKALKEGVYI